MSGFDLRQAQAVQPISVACVIQPDVHFRSGFLLLFLVDKLDPVGCEELDTSVLERSLTKHERSSGRDRPCDLLDGADGATAPETLRHKDRVVGRSGERRLMASTEGDIRTARAG
jgi:hypothetical protein